ARILTCIPVLSANTGAGSSGEPISPDCQNPSARASHWASVTVAGPGPGHDDSATTHLPRHSRDGLEGTTLAVAHRASLRERRRDWRIHSGSDDAACEPTIAVTTSPLSGVT